MFCATKIFSTIKGCIDGRVEADGLGSEGTQTNHMLDSIHTHVGIGLYVVDNRLRYVEASQRKFYREWNSRP